MEYSFFKRLISLLIALCIAVSCMAFLPSCADNGDNTSGNSDASDSSAVSSSNEPIKDESVAQLSDNWMLARVKDVAGATGAELSKSSYADNDAWITATVPATVLTSYMNAGKIDDPYFGNRMNELNQDYYNVDYWYRTSFTVPKDYNGRRVWLNFDGINWKADIYVNGIELGNIKGAFIRGKFDITELLTDGKNYLAVYIHWCDSQIDDMPSFLCSASWDWMPAIPGRNMGIYKPVYLTASDDVSLADPYVTTDIPLPSVNTATVSTSVYVNNNSDKQSNGVLHTKVIRSDNSGRAYELSKDITLEAGESKLVTFDDVIVDNPDLWWPNGSGEQPLYVFSVDYTANGTVSDCVETTFGIRKLSYTYTNGDLTVIVNGRRILCKGGNWGIPDAMLRYTDDDFKDAVKMQADQNFNMVRTWHGTSDFDAFYKYCDEYGIMVFEDFWLNGWTAPRDIDMFMDNVYDKVKRLRNHACIVVWCGENEAIPPAPLNKKIPAALEELDTSRLYVPSSNSGAVAGGVTYAIQDPSWYFMHTVGFTTEIGTPCIPSVQSMRKMMNEKDLWPVGNEVWSLHDWNFGIGNKLVDTYKASINYRYGTAKTIDDFCKKAQLLNYETYKAIFEAWNDTAFTDTSGVLLWMSHPAWPSTIWQTYDYYKEGSGGYYASKLACEPIHIQWNCLTGAVKVVNTTDKTISGATAQVTVYNLDGTVKFDRSYKVSASALAATNITELLGSGTGTNIAAKKSVTASSSEENNPAKYVNDDNHETRWTASSKGAEWIAVDLGTIKKINRVNVEWENAFAKGYRIEISTDNSNWTVVKTVANGDGGNDSAGFDVTDARYVRVFCTSAGTMWNYSIYEIQVIEYDGKGEEITGLSDTHFIKLKLMSSSGELLGENFYWRSISDTDYTAMESMKKATVDTSFTRTDNADGTTSLQVTLKNKSKVCAISLRLIAQKSFIMNEDEDFRILPTYYEDNYFSLTPEETRTLTVTFDTADLNGAESVITVEGFNTKTQLIYQN